MTRPVFTLTSQQRQAFNFIENYISARHGVAPTLDEITEALSLRSKGNTHRILKALEQRGYIRRLPQCGRRIFLEVAKIKGRPLTRWPPVSISIGP